MNDNIKDEMFSWLAHFLIDNYWYDFNVPQQARSVFTTICMLYHVDFDSDLELCGDMLYELWLCASTDEIEIDYNDFVNFMVAWLV